MKKVVMTVEDRGIDYSPILANLERNGIEAVWNPLKDYSQEEILRVTDGADGVIAGVEKWDAETISKTKGLKIIARYGIGYDSVDIKAASEKGIYVTNTPKVLSEAVAELALAFYLALNRNLMKHNAELHRGDWGLPMMGHDIAEKCVGIIGFGSIGQRFAELLQPFRCRILAYDPFFNEKTATRLAVKKASIQEIIEEADCISLHVPVTSETRNLVNAEFLSKMKPSAFLINTGRGALVDEQALKRALENGEIAGAALDVFTVEPLKEDHIFRNVPNLLLSPHIGSATQESFMKAGLLAANCVIDALSGKQPNYVLN